MPCQIIYLGGPSSSGKSSLAAGLQEKFEEPFLHMGIDRMIALMPTKINDWWGGPAPDGFSWKETHDAAGQKVAELQIGPFARRVSDAMVDVVLALAAQDFHIIIDDVPLSQGSFDRWREALRPYAGLFVGMWAPIEILEERERERSNRMLGSARSQFYKSARDFGYDLLIDSSRVSLPEQIDLIEQRRGQ